MSFLESIQHGLEKASQEAARITKVQHLHNVVNDLTFKASQQGQTLIAQAMDMYHNGHLGQGELVAICQQIALYQQQINEVQEELQKLQQHGDNVEQPVLPVLAPPTDYSAYAQEAPTEAYNTIPTAPLVQPNNLPDPVSSNEPTINLGAISQENMPSSSEAPTKPSVAKRHTTTHKESSVAALPTDLLANNEPSATSAPGSYAQGVLPPVYSPFAAHPTPVPTEESVEAEPVKPAKAHHTKKAAATEPAEVLEDKQ